MRRLTLLLLLLLGCGWMTASAQDDLLGRINALRASKGLPPYSGNGALTAAAQDQAQWMVDNGCAIAHTRPDGSNPRSRALAAGYTTSDVSENIYCGGRASANDAWTFWVNSGIHYAGLVNTRYKEIGIASASGSAGRSYVLVFGNPGGPDYVPPAPPGGGGQGSSGPPSFVVGVDAVGNIKHEIQEGDTLGQIALIYGYTWSDIPGMLALNGMTEADYRKLKVGDIFLVPPWDGTYTPTPGDAPTEPPAATQPASYTPEPTLTAPPPSLTPTATVFVAATANTVPIAMNVLMPTPTPGPSPTAVEVAALPTDMPTLIAQSSSGVVVTSSGTSPWLIVGLLIQVGILLGAGFEFIRRSRLRR